jgi:group I intron endonuclease
MTAQANQSGIYKITCSANGRFYIGSAANLLFRKRSHISSLKKGGHKNSKLQRAWNKYGESCFSFKTILVCDINNLLMYEQIIIDGFDAVKNGFNICPIAGSGFGRTHSEETKAKMKEAWEKRRLAPFPPVSEEARRKISESKLGKKRKPFTEEARKNMSLSRMGNKNRLGIPHTEETKAKMKAIQQMKKGLKK